MSSSSLTLTQSSTLAGRSVLLCLPFELRLDIYEKYLYSEYYGEIDEGIMWQTGRDSPSTVLLLTCKQIYDEVRPIIYQAMTVSSSLSHWDRFLNRIGPHNISLVKHLTINYSCSPADYWGECRGDKPKNGEPMIINKWLGIFQAFQRAQPNLQLKKITMYMEPCDGYWPGGSEGHLFASHYTKYQNCRAYNELELLKVISKFSGIHQIVFENKFNPLWGMFFRHRLGFVLKRAQNGNMTLVNPDHPDYGVDLRNHVASKLLEGVYDEIVQEPEKSGGTEDQGVAALSDALSSWVVRDSDEIDPLAQQW
ncbi:hypothetical protein K449DRAFT_433287 [Hypoxylon sp. EC38]|nr:hypothetical protein K449DRAFT_433287 [Hypoxylon sp. EC38]